MSELYKAAGVDIEKGDELVSWLKSGEDSGSGGEVVSGIGGFAALFRPNFSGMTDPLLISGTDGVGTKVLLGIDHGQLRGLGQDLVAMCVNDLYCVGGRPLFFLDYYATGALDKEQFKEVLAGIREGLSQCQTALLGGETAELPGLYKSGHFDLAGFVVGVVDSPRQMKAANVKQGDVLIALESSGFHSNGYSLVRKLIADTPISAELLHRLLEPTRIYGRLPELFSRFGPETIHGVANITGGGISGNLVRCLPKGVSAMVVRDKLPTPDWMTSFIGGHGLDFEQVEGVLNMGVGMVLTASADQGHQVAEQCVRLGMPAKVIGEVVASEAGRDPFVRYV